MSKQIKNRSKLTKVEKHVKLVQAEINKIWSKTTYSINDAISLTDRDGKILRCNKAMTKLVGKSYKGIIGDYCDRLFSNIDHPSDICPRELVKKSKKRELRTLKSKNRWYNCVVDPLTDANGEITNLLHILSDVTFIKTSEEKLNQEKIKTKNSIQNLKNAQNIALIGYFELNLKNNRIVLSENLYNIFKIDPKEFDENFKTIISMIHPFDQKSVKKALEVGIKNKKLIDLEHRMVRNDYSEIHVKIRAKPYYNDSGVPLKILGTVQDITDAKNAQNNQKETVQLLNNVGAISKIGGWEMDIKSGGKAKWTKATYNIVEVDYQEPIPGYKNHIDYYLPKYQKMIREKMKKLLLKKEKLYFQAQLKTEKNKIIWVEARGKAVTEDGKVVKLMGTLQDITKQKKIEQVLFEKSFQMQALMDNTHDWIFIKDKDSKFIFNNKTHRRLFGVSSKENIIGKTDFDFFVREDANKYFSQEQNIIKTGKPLLNKEELTYSKQKKEKIWIEFSKVPLKDPTGKINGIVGIARDITDRKEAEKNLKDSYGNLKKIFNGTIKTLASIVEIRDPYTSGHQKRVTQLVIKISEELGFTKERIEAIALAAQLHDIGKINIPTSILAKPGKISDIEYRMIKTHPQLGCNMLKNIEFSLPVIDIILQHHEKEDGSGYPNGLKGKDIRLEAKILLVADVVEAMSSHRPYRPALSINKAIREIRKNRGKLFNPEIVDVCVELFEDKGFKFK
jgi:PAS domain S-box-containing protein/putative nucleotidyltransferase with HDIG domain